MTYNSELKDGSDLNKVEIPQACRNAEFSVNPDLYVKDGGGDGCIDENELRALFDQVLSFFLKEVSVNKDAFRPFPPKLGDGQEADLFKLFLTVRRIGSYELVSENDMWEFVAMECGLEIGLVGSLKLLYVKYLKELDQWLIKGGFKDEKMENVEIGVIQKLDLLSRQLDGHGCSLSDQIGKSLSNGEIVGSKDGKKGIDVSFLRINGDDEELRGGEVKTCELSPENVVKKVGFSVINDDNRRSELSPEKVVKKVGLSVIDDNDDDEEFSVEDEKQVGLSIKKDDDGVNVVSHDVNIVENVVSSQKRKREEEHLSLSEMLDWVANAARDPHGTAIEASKGSSKGKNDRSDKLWKQVLSARKALFAELNVDSGNEAGGSQKKNQRMHPAMYEDKASEGTRCSGRVVKPSSRIKRQRAESGKAPVDRTSKTNEPQDHEYNLGSRYQAEVPEWTGPVYDSDSKWLGTRMWPPPDDHDEKNEKAIVPVGLGRRDSCECLVPGSAECVRFHVAENRLKLKIELGPLFYKWKFNLMGEEASLSWQPEEEKQFKSLVIKARQDLAHSNKSRHEIMNKFWKRASDSIPAKPKQKLVCYYFNVFVLRRRSYQNRVTPKEIDSDNDEQEVGTVGDRFGYEKIHGLSLKCSENKQCTDLES
ncbi:AT-rich interactive domain-containing protein 2-like [Cynara cardunculus var. scolymus]|uniref:AT-rich interactive domain-containing protein 2-like n=1 Tax=Cynara cardunculus var. scolymus TaxID=59895 RepID=UPI000D6303D9|nr:AT-rich interactive domain-containing protein 2-like [Cynara cardunculus var. scolymus]